MTIETEATVQIDQCLYGYNDGHRLLASSRKLPEDAASLLLVHSDLVAGAMGDDEGYWTGIPVPAARCYALMRTWPAPEMPRPGCVWTHALLIAFADIARFAELGILSYLVARPNQSSGFADYAKSLTVDLELKQKRRPSIFSAIEAVRILRAIYSPEASGVLLARGRSQEDTIFAIWSQQWPRLRRSFSFQTTGLSSTISSSFDLRLVIDAARGVAEVENEVSFHEWERTALDDLNTTGVGDFRRFIWRYGSDIRRGRERFRFLAGLFNLTRCSSLDCKTLNHILDKVANTLPDSDDGKVLKTDLVSSGNNDYSLLPPSDPLDVIEYFVRVPHYGALPLPPASAYKAMSDVWPARADKILSIVEQALGTSPRIIDEIMPPLAEIIEPSTFVALSQNHPAARLHLVRSNPALLDSPGLENIPPAQLSTLLDQLPNDIGLTGRVLDRLLALNDDLMARKFADRFPSLVAERVFDAIASQLAGAGPNVPSQWIAAIGNVLKSMLPSKMLNRVKSTSALAACAILLQLDVRAGLTAPPSTWAAALKGASDDLSGQSKQRLFAYLLALALAQPSPGCELLFECTFEQTHADIAVSRLPYDAFNALAAYLPNLYWWQQWDTCLRLRTAVVEAYVVNDLDPKSFRRLTGDPQLFNRLVDLAADMKHGSRFLKRLRSDYSRE